MPFGSSPVLFDRQPVARHPRSSKKAKQSKSLCFVKVEGKEKAPSSIPSSLRPYKQKRCWMSEVGRRGEPDPGVRGVVERGRVQRDGRGPPPLLRLLLLQHHVAPFSHPPPSPSLVLSNLAD